MKNPHGVEPTQFMKRESEYAIKCNPSYGPIFGNTWTDILINDNCNRENSCEIDGTNGYECHPIHKKSLFVNTAGPYKDNYFEVLDYEVYTHN